MAPDPGPEAFEVERGGVVLRGETEGEGIDVVLCHGLSATRNFVVHGSRHLPRSGYRLNLFDARGHGRSDPSPDLHGYEYTEQVGDLEAVIEQVAQGPELVVGGHSMGCHTSAAWALRNPDRVAALVLIGPVFGDDAAAGSDDRWDARAKALEEEGPEGFAACIGEEFQGDAADRELVTRIALRRAREHDYPTAVAEALRQVPRSRPFESLEQLDSISAPTLVVGSRDEIDSGHPLSVAQAWASRIPRSELVVEGRGESPLAWQGGRLSREISAFLDRHLEPNRGRN